MTGEQLRNELARIAEGAPQVRVGADVFDRGRRAHRRVQMLTAAAVVAVLAVVTGGAMAFLRDDPPPIAGREGDSLGVPDHIHAVPGHVSARSSDLAIGVGAAAFMTGVGTTVVVDAETGDYHVLDLGIRDGDLSWSPMDLVGDAVSLSPDGRRLAWGWFGPADGKGDRAAGIQVADLETGEVREVPLRKRAGVLVDSLAWSADGQWLAWRGSVVQAWRENGFSTDGLVAGVIGPDLRGSTIRAVPEPVVRTDGIAASGEAPDEIAVSDEGRLVVLAGNLVWDEGVRSRRFELSETASSGGLWFDGDQLNTLTADLSGETDPVIRMLQPSVAEVAQLPTTLAQPRMVGLLAPGEALVHQEVEDGDESTFGGVQLIAYPQGRTWPEPRTIIEVDPGVTSLTLATTLMDPDDPTVTRPEPEWPWSNERKVGVFGGIGLGVLMVTGVCWLLLRRRRSRS